MMTKNLAVCSLGRGGFLVSHQGQSVLLNPWRTCPNIDFATLSRDFDPAVVAGLAAQNPRIRLIVPPALSRRVAEASGLPETSVHPINSEQTVRANGVLFQGVATAHPDRDEEGRQQHMSHVVSLGSFTVYHSGGTKDYPGLDNRLRRHEIDLAFLFLGAETMSGREAAALARRSSLNRAVPWGPDALEEFASTCEKLRQPYFLPREGESFLVTPDGSCQQAAVPENLT